MRVVISSSPSSRNKNEVLQRCGNTRCRKPVLTMRGAVMTPRGLRGVKKDDGALILLGQCPVCGEKWSADASEL